MRLVLGFLVALLLTACAGPQVRGTGDLGLVIERPAAMSRWSIPARANPMRASAGWVISRMPPPSIRATAATPSSSGATAG